MGLIVFAALVGMPLLELFLLIKAGGAIGVLPVIALSIATAAIGTFILRRQGFAALQQMREQVAADTPPVEPVAHGVILIAAAPLLMTPGFITDAVGFALLAPEVRRRIARAFLRMMRSRMDRGESVIFIRRV